MKKLGKKGQVTLFIIIAIILVVAIVGFFVFRGYFSSTGVPSAVQPVYNYYLSCIEQATREGAIIMGSRGGYIETPEFFPGSAFMPSSSQLDFYGNPVPYWFYVSGNNIVREQVPTKQGMEQQLSDYISNNIDFCDFSEFESRGFLVDFSESAVEVKIEDARIQVDIENTLVIGFDEGSYSRSKHSVSVNSKLGSYYNLAKDIYSKQKNENFLDYYALDTLSLNAPTSGLEPSCAPLIFNFGEIRSDIALAVSENMPFVRLRGNSNQGIDPYFLVDLGKRVNENVQFMYSPEWPTKIQIHGDTIYEPVGLQDGMAILGFCFVDYDILYDAAFPVMVQIFDEIETFQFPVITIIEKNRVNPNLTPGNFFGVEEVVCRNRNQEMLISTSDLNGNPVPASLSFNCLQERCFIGETSLIAGRAAVETTVPMCVNGHIEAFAEGYSVGRYIVSSNEENVADVLMKKIYSVELNLGNIPGDALVQFISEDFSRSVLYPETRNIDLVSGIYDVQVHIYGDSSLNIPGRTEKRCFEIPSTGLGALIGRTNTECFDVEIPAQNVDSVLVGGGKSVEFFSEDALSSFTRLNINVPLYGPPRTIQEISENYIKLEDSFLTISFS